MLVGPGLALVLHIASVIICYFAGYLLLEVADVVGAQSFHQLAAITLGRSSPRCRRCVLSITALLKSICLLGASVSALVFNKNVAAEAMRVMGAPGFLTATWFWALIILWGIVLPILISPRISCLKYLALLVSALCILYLGVAVWGLSLFELPAATDIQYFKSTNVANIQQAFTLLIYAYLVQPNLQTVFHELERPSLRRKLKALALDFASVFLFFSALSILTYLPFAAKP